MSEMVDRVARALETEAEAIRKQEEQSGPIGVDARWPQLARAAIEAMREPTEGMLGAVYGNHGETDGSDQSARKTWGAMIDAALE
jgi:hypothetical protein